MMALAFEVVVIGAGAAGMMAAAVAGQRGRRVLLIDHARKLAEKIRISGGGRCNFTNRDTRPERFLSRNPHFCKSALSAYTPRDFIALVDKYGIGYHEKHKGQLFCNDSSQRIIDLLRAECAAGGVRWQVPSRVDAVARVGEGFRVDTDQGEVRTRALIIATGGLSIPPIGATDFGLRIAKQFGLKVIPPRPALVPLTFAATDWGPFVPLAGIGLPVRVATATESGTRIAFDEDLLITHRGLSGPAVLQISSYWQPGHPLHLNLTPGIDVAAHWLEAKRVHPRRTLGHALGEHLPQRLAHGWLSRTGLANARLADLPDKLLRHQSAALADWQITPNGSEGFRKAEVTLGGVDTEALTQNALEVRGVAGLHFIGEVVDVTGWLGGYNFQWAWASGAAAGRAV
jgi:hypothetical protein